MASSSRQKSSSSASRAPKPTFRRAGGTGVSRAGSKSDKASAPRSSAPASKASSKKPARSYMRSYTVSGKKSRAQAASSRTLKASGKAASPAGSASLKRKKPATPSRRQAPSAAPRKAAPKPTRRTAPAASAPAAPPKAQRGATKLKQPLKQSRGGASLTTLSSKPSAKGSGSPVASALGAVGGFLGGIGRAIFSLVSGKVVGIGIAAVAVVAIAAVVVINSPIFAATDIQINGSEHLSQETVEQLIEIPGGTTLLNVDADAISEQLGQSPWVSGVSIERKFPNTLVITPTERKVAAIAYINSDDIAWAIGDDECWIAPVSLAVTVDAEGNVIAEAPSTPSAENTPADDAEQSGGEGASQAPEDGGADGASEAEDAGEGDAQDGADASADGASDAAADAEAQDVEPDEGEETDEGTSDAEPAPDAPAADGSSQLGGIDAARAIARSHDALLLTDVPADVEPSSGQEVTSEVILAGLAYAKGFSPDFMAQISQLSLPSVDAISAYMDSGIEIALGAPDDIDQKEAVVTRLLEQQQGVTYVNVRTPDHYTFRSAPAS